MVGGWASYCSPRGTERDPKLRREVRVCSESFEIHKKNIFLRSAPSWEREHDSHWVKFPGLAVCFGDQNCHLEPSAE